MSLIISDDKTCPAIDEETGEVCHCYGDGYFCAAGHSVSPGNWIPMPPVMRARLMEQTLRGIAKDRETTYREELAEMKLTGYLEFEGANLLPEIDTLTEEDFRAARVRKALFDLVVALRSQYRQPDL